MKYEDCTDRLAGLVPETNRRRTMKPEIKKLWVDALRSGEYKQGKGVLYDGDDNSYCCIGVLCRLAELAGVPMSKDYFVYPVELPEIEIAEWAGLKTLNCNEFVQLEGNTRLAVLNDRGKSFSEIADIIEEQL